MSQKPRILFICNKFPYPANDGGTIAVMSLVKAFAHLDCSVSVLGMNTFKHYVNLSTLPEDIKSLATYYAVDVDIKIKIVPALANLLFSSKPYHVWRFNSKEFRQQLEGILRREHFDLIQLEGLYLTEYVSLIKQYAPATPVVLRAHNIEHELWERQAEEAKNGRSNFKYAYLKETANRIKEYEHHHTGEGSYDAIVPITKRDASQFKKMGASVPIQVCPAGADFSHLPTATPYIPSSEFAQEICYIGALDWMPNMEAMKWFLKRVWPKLKSQYPDLRFHLAGRNMDPWFANYSKPDVIVHGEVDDAYDFMQNHGILISPLFSGGGMRVKIIEGMALAKPIVASRIAAEGIPVKHGEHLMLADNAAEFIQCIGTLLEKPRMAETIGKQAHELVREKFDTDAIGAKLLRFYEKTFWAPKEEKV
ncbi:MAG: glycosyltransferase family 4 protein [Bacteroidia bacterium]